jgi:hypothetical protein
MILDGRSDAKFKKLKGLKVGFRNQVSELK